MQLQKFLQTGERGALITNADYRVGTPAQPAFDWINMAQLQLTLDRILQESVALYDPSMQVIVFVFLLSNSGNSMAVWRRKLPVPESLRQAYEQDIMAAKENLEQDYPVYVEECVYRICRSPPSLNFGWQITAQAGGEAEKETQPPQQTEVAEES